MTTATVRCVTEDTEPPLSQADRNSLTIVANRLPVHRNADNKWELSPGGLVSALVPVLQKRQGRWIGWGGSCIVSDRTTNLKVDGIILDEVAISKLDFEQYYTKISNGVLWPLFHDRLRQPEFSQDAWRGYRRVNALFAERAAETCPHGGLVWIQDYHLLLVPGMLKARRPDLCIGLFLHTPVPPEGLFQTLPWRDEISESLDLADCIGTQTDDDRNNLVDTLSSLNLNRHTEERRVRCFPISIDSQRTERAARQAEADNRVDALRNELGTNRTIFLGVDRLDYTKGLDQRLKALEYAFESQLIHPSAVRFIQIAVPSRREVEEYQEISSEIDRMIGNINGTYSGVGEPVIHYHRHVLSPAELAVLYRAADVMVVTPLKDGMNLVAKEYVASRYDGTGELILSEFAGASRELSAATLINPNDIESLARAYAQAHRMRDRDLIRPSMQQMHKYVMRADVYLWANRFLDSLARRAESANSS